MPWRVVLELQRRGWIVRNDIVWHKPNAMPESVTDRLATRYEHLFLLTRSPRYYFGLDAIKVVASGRRGGNRNKPAYAAAVGTDKAARRFGNNDASTLSTKEFEDRNPGDVWTVATRGSGHSHFAMFPIDIPNRCIAAGTTGRAAKSLGRPLPRHRPQRRLPRPRRQAAGHQLLVLGTITLPAVGRMRLVCIR